MAVRYVNQMFRYAALNLTFRKLKRYFSIIINSILIEYPFQVRQNIHPELTSTEMLVSLSECQIDHICVDVSNFYQFKNILNMNKCFKI